VIEPGQNYSTAFIAQDASVVPDPFADNANPAVALVELLQQAAEKGISLIVCTNRGVLERAFASHYLDRNCSGKLWFDAIRSAVLGKEGFTRDFDGGGRKAFKSVAFSYTTLDRRSLLVGRGTFEKLVERAVDAQHWTACDSCQSQERCPFFQNRCWLAQPESRETFVRVIRHGELLSGQVVVFREALALLSLVLAGCPHDYAAESPCKWVHSRVADSKWFSLLSRRVYMTLFSAFSPYGLEPFDDDRAEQQNALRGLAAALVGPRATTCRQSLDEVIANSPSISTDVGIERLVGSRGIFRTMGYESDVQPREFYNKWDDAGSTMLEGASGPFSALERECADVWALLRDTAEASSDVSASSYRWLARWITSHTHRAGALLDGSLTFASEIDDLFKILSVGNVPDDAGLMLIEQIESDLWRMLHSSGEGTQISTFARLKGEWVRSKLQPTIDRPEGHESQSIVLTLKFGDHTQIPLSALAFAWLKRCSTREMSAASFPLEYLETASQALVKAASESKYYTQNSNVELVVTLPGADRRASLKRTRGRVIVDGL
jgi:hypothetical protein